MSNVTIAGGTNNLPTANSIDPIQDVLPIYTASSTATQGINRNTFLGLSSAPVGLTDSQTLTNKTLTTPTLTGPSVSGTITGTYTLGGTPTFPSSVVTLTGTQTLTNKTFTSPTINSPTITNASITADSISGFTTSNAGSVFGVSISGGALAANTVGTTQLAANSVTGAKISSYSTNRDNNGSNTTESSALLQTGWGAITVGSTVPTINTSVTFPIAFTNSIPIVVATPGGDQASGSIVYGNGGSTIQADIDCKVTAPTKTGFNIFLHSSTGNWTSGNIVYFQWIAIGA